MLMFWWISRRRQRSVVNLDVNLTSLLDIVTVDESIREEDGSDDEEEDKDEKDDICQLSNQRMASQRRDKSCAPSH